MKLRRHYEKPSERRAREAAEAVPPGEEDGAQTPRTRRFLSWNSTTPAI